MLLLHDTIAQLFLKDVDVEKPVIVVKGCELRASWLIKRNSLMWNVLFKRL